MSACQPAYVWRAEPLVRSNAEGRYDLSVAPPAQGTKVRRLYIAAPGIVMALAAASPVVFVARLEIPTASLIPGATLRGRVRDSSGKVLAGVRVVARDAMLERGSGGGRTDGSFFCAASTEEQGWFALPGALPAATRLVFRKPGYLRTVLEPVALGSDTSVVMVPSGFAQGRVVDREGRPIGGAAVELLHEVDDGLASGDHRTAIDGTFRLPLELPGRWRVSASHPARHPGPAFSAIHERPADHLEIVMGDLQSENLQLPLLVVDRRTGQPVAACRVVGFATDDLPDDEIERELQWRSYADDGRVDPGGEAKLRWPREAEARVPWLRVVAPGHAPATLLDVAWSEGVGGAAFAPVRVELEPEAAVEGRVVDAASGQPIAGVVVFAQPELTGSQRSWYLRSSPPADAATTRADGVFRVGSLGAGKWQLLTRCEGRPAAPMQSFELADGERRGGFVLAMPARPTTATLTGRLQGDWFPEGAAVELQTLDLRDDWQDWEYRFGERVEIGRDGSFRFDAVPIGLFSLRLWVPQPGRYQQGTLLSVDAFFEDKMESQNCDPCPDGPWPPKKK